GALEPPDLLLTWTEAEIEHEICRQLPPSAAFVCQRTGSGWDVRIELAGEPDSLFEHVDKRMALYAAYGHLWLRRQRPTPQGSQWDASVPRPTVASVNQYVQTTFADPEDLDPAQVASVYGLAS